MVLTVSRLLHVHYAMRRFQPAKNINIQVVGYHYLRFSSNSEAYVLEVYSRLRDVPSLLITANGSRPNDCIIILPVWKILFFKLS